MSHSGGHLQIPRGENAVDEKGSFKNYWTAYFSILGKRLNAAGDTAPVASPDASDLATAITLANELKAQMNALLNALDT